MNNTESIINFTENQTIKTNIAYSFELLTFPFYEGIRYDKNVGAEKNSLLLKHTLCFRLFLKNLNCKYLKPNQRIYSTLGIAPSDIFRGFGNNAGYNVVYGDLGICLGNFKSIKVNKLLELNFNKKFCAVLFTDLNTKFSFLNFIIGIGGEVVTYMSFFQTKENQTSKLPFDIGIIFKYWYNFYYTGIDVEYGTILNNQFFAPTMSGQALFSKDIDFNIYYLFNSCSSLGGLSYYTCFSIKF